MILAVASASRPAAARLASGGFGTTALLFFRRTISLASLVHVINRHGKSLPARLNAKISSAISSEGTHIPDTTLQLPAPAPLSTTRTQSAQFIRTLGSRKPVFCRINNQFWSVDFFYRLAGLLDRFRLHPG